VLSTTMNSFVNPPKDCEKTSIHFTAKCKLRRTDKSLVFLEYISQLMNKAKAFKHKSPS
jgi:hypothetical protein